MYYFKPDRHQFPIHCLPWKIKAFQAGLVQMTKKISLQADFQEE